MPEEYESPDGPDNLELPPSFFPIEGTGLRRDGSDHGELVEVEVDGIYQQEGPQEINRYVVVSEKGRKLPIRIGAFEAQAIQLVLEGTRPDRPMTHDLVRSILERLDATVERVAIDDFWNSIYYAKIYLRKGTEEIEIDARPSDAVALALRFDAPIYVSDSIMDGGLDD